MKKVLIPVLAVGLSLFAGCVLAVGCVIHTGAHWSQSVNLKEKATRTDSHALELAPGETLEITRLSGDVQVEAGAAGTGSLSALITAYGETPAEASERLARAKVVVERLPAGVRIRVEPEQDEYKRGGIQMNVAPRFDLKLRIPENVKLAFELSSGDITTRGPIGPSRLSSSYGDLKVGEASGNLTLSTSSGDIDVGNVEKAQELDARSSYGEVAARKIAADKIILHSSSGDVQLVDGTCSAAELVSQYGDVKLARVSGKVEARTSSGAVEGQELGGQEALLSSGYGDVTLKHFKGSAQLSSSSGDVHGSGLSGTCEAKSGYGEVKLSGILSGVQAESQSGAVRVEALPGSAPESDWKITSGYGDVSLALPRDLGFELAASTNYGALDLQVPLLLEAGALKEKRAVRGMVSGGGRLVTITTSSGDVKVSYQSKPR